MTQRLLGWAGRQAPTALAGTALEDLAGGVDAEAVARRRGLPRAAVGGISSFYDQLDPALRVCDGTACHYAGGPALAAELGAGVVRCLGLCHDAPALRVGDTVAGASDNPLSIAGFPASHAPARRSLVDPPILLRNVLGARVQPAAEYEMPDGDAILALLDASGLRGRGGAAYPTGAKWRSARDTPADLRYVVVNGDEGDPGSFVDRVLMEEDPHAILAGMQACARVIGRGASRSGAPARVHGIVFVRGEYPRARATMAEAAAEAHDAGWLDADFEVEVRGGAGSYVVGEETALLRAIEGLRGEPSPKPPYPAQCGLYGLPTVVQNVETLAQVPWLVRNGRRADTKVVSLSGAVARPGLVEIALGTPLSRVLAEGGGGPAAGRRWKMVLIGGPMGRVLPVDRFDTPLGYDTLPGLGHAGVVVLDDTVSARDLALHLMDFAAAESCGTCTPCRVGTGLLARAPDRVALERLCDTLEIGSLCGFGQGVPRPLRDLLSHYGSELYPC